MNLFFWKKPSASSDRLIQDWDSRFRRIEDSLARLSENIGEKSKTTSVTIEHVHIHQPVLERLEFRLDGLDIEHLSGSLNLGNNFGAKMTSSSSAAPSASQPSKPLPAEDARLENRKQASAEPSSGGAHGLERTPSGFRLRKS